MTAWVGSARAQQDPHDPACTCSPPGAAPALSPELQAKLRLEYTREIYALRLKRPPMFWPTAFMVAGGGFFLGGVYLTALDLGGEAIYDDVDRDDLRDARPALLMAAFGAAVVLATIPWLRRTEERRARYDREIRELERRRSSLASATW